MNISTALISSVKKQSNVELATLLAVSYITLMFLFCHTLILCITHLTDFPLIFLSFYVRGDLFFIFLSFFLLL